MPSLAPSLRVRNTLVDAARPSQFPRLEFHLRKLNKFFIRESIYTVYPDCENFVRAQESQLAQQNRDGGVSVCLLFTFQENEGALAPATEEELHEEREAFLRGLRKNGETEAAKGGGAPSPQSPVSSMENNISDLIGYRPESYIWKDKSREVFFDFCRYVQDALRDAWAGDGNDAAIAPTGDDFFLDWCDPATGLPMNSRRGGSSFTDADAIELMFPYHSVLVAGAGGGCRMIQHPTFGLCVYPATAVLSFPTDRQDLVKRTLQSLCT